MTGHTAYAAYPAYPAYAKSSKKYRKKLDNWPLRVYLYYLKQKRSIFIMPDTVKVFYDGLETVRLTDGVIHLEFYNEVTSGTETKKVPAGEAVLSQPAFLRAYGAMTDLIGKLEAAGLIKRKTAEPGSKPAAETSSGSPNFE